MALKTYLYRAEGVTDADLVSLLAAGAGATVGTPVNQTLVPITVDEIHKDDLDDAMASLRYSYVAEYTDPAPIVARRNYGVLVSDPVGTTPGAGDYYYNSSLQMEMQYDSLRSKWLSVESTQFTFGRDGNTMIGQYYRSSADGRVMSDTIGWQAVRSGTVVSLGFTRSDTSSATFEIVADGTGIGEVSTSAASGRDVSLDADFTFNQILAARNKSTGDTTRNVVAWIRVRWRS